MALVPGFFTTLIVSFVKVVVRFETALANRREAKALLHWDARALKDIGLTPSDVRGAMQLPISEDPTHLLSLIAAGREAPVRRDSASWTEPSRPVAAGKVRLGTLPSAEPALCS